MSPSTSRRVWNGRPAVMCPHLTFRSLILSSIGFAHGARISVINPDWSLVALALEDVLPVLLSVSGFIVLARLSTSLNTRAGAFVWAGAALIGIGGVTKPIYKSMLALTSGAVDWMVLDRMLFWLLAPGFILIGEGLRSAARTHRGTPTHPRLWMVIVALGVVAGGAAAALYVEGSRVWFFFLLGIATLGNLWVAALLIRWASSSGDRLGAGLFAGNIVVVFGLAGAAAALEQTIPIQWGEQLAATAAQGVFLLAGVRLSRRVSAHSEAPS